MKNISILVLENAVLQSIADSQQCFRAANRFLTRSGRLPVFNVEMAGLKKRIGLNDGKYCVYTDKLLKDATRPDLIIIPSLSGNIEKGITANSGLLPWIVDQYNKGSEIASLCVGSFLLASTGLLDGRKCSTHWAYTNLFRRMYPGVFVEEKSIITEDKGIYSSGGANSYWNMLIYLVEKYTDRQTAILVSKYFAIDISRESQASFAMFIGHKEHNDDAVREAQLYIEDKIGERIRVDRLAEKVAVGRRSFERRFKKATNNSVLGYIQHVKVEAAKLHFETSRKNISEVMMEVGYSDPKAFRTIFKKITGLSPIEYRKKYNRIPPTGTTEFLKASGG